MEIGLEDVCADDFSGETLGLDLGSLALVSTPTSISDSFRLALLVYVILAGGDLTVDSDMVKYKRTR
jgi:hypothetical protein